MNERNTVLVCITPQKSSKKLVEAGKIIAEKNNADLEVISVLPISANASDIQADVLERLLCFSREAGGEMAVYFSDEPVFTVAAHITKTKPMLMVVGFPGENSNGFVSLIHLIVPNLPISMVAQDDKIYNMLPFESNHLLNRR